MTIRLGLVVILLVFPPLSSGADPLLKLSGGWEYLRGDSPVDDQGRFSWMHDDSSEWKSFDPHESLLEDDHYVWFRVRLPAGEWRDPATPLRIKDR